jgi:hypothetical protein
VDLLDQAKQRLLELRPHVTIESRAVRTRPMRLIGPIVVALIGVGACLAINAVDREYVRVGRWLVPGWIALVHDEYRLSVSPIANIAGLIVMWSILIWVRLIWYMERHAAVVVAAVSFCAGVTANTLQPLFTGSVTDYLLLRHVATLDAADVLLYFSIATITIGAFSPRQLDVNYRDVVMFWATIGISFVLLGVASGGNSGPHQLAVVAFAALIWIALHLHWLASGGYETRRLFRSWSRDRLDRSPTDTISDLELIVNGIRGRDARAERYLLAALCASYVDLEKPVELRRSAEALLQICERLAGSECQAWGLDYLGRAEWLSGDHEAALAQWRDALELTDGTRDSHHRLMLMGRIAFAEAQAGQESRSRQTFQAAIDLAVSLGDQRRVATLATAMTRLASSDMAEGTDRNAEIPK